ncbi:hypothetical protein F2Q70_00031758 [Brassica cretica]|uniref:Uncharacterized protein n=1 Tax=Brassica cretica TaxID=69181 RepID=A0A8S9FJL3_BRACR|nr:hypothetical protein F2Q70_00031758 [Brassica cretica]
MNSAGILMDVQFLRRRANITGKKITAGVIFASPMDATLRQRCSDRVHCFSVVFYCLHALLTTSHTIFVSKTMMHVVKILRLLVAVSTFRIALLLAAVDGKLNFPSHQHETHAFRSQYAISTGNPLWGLGDPNKAPAYDQLPHSTSFFSEKSGSGVSLCGKLPHLHQWHKLRPQPSELIAELYSSNGHDRYEAIAEIFANQ